MSMGAAAHTALNTDNGVAHMAIAAYGIGGAYLLHGLDSLDLVGIGSAVDAHQLAFLKAKGEYLAAGLGRMLEICTLGQTLGAGKYLASTDAGAPYADVVGIF